MVDARRVRNFYLLSCLAVLAACSNGRGSLEEADSEGGQQQAPPKVTIGGSIAGTAADKWGRKLPLMLSVLWFSLFAFLSGFSTSYAMKVVTAGAHPGSSPRKKPIPDERTMVPPHRRISAHVGIHPRIFVA